MAALSSAQSAKKAAAAQQSVNAASVTDPSLEHSSNSNNAVGGEHRRSARSPDRVSSSGGHRQSPPPAIQAVQKAHQVAPHAGVTIASNDVSASDHVSDRQQTMNNLFDSVFEYHATSITRFDTAHMDFDQRLAQCIQDSQDSQQNDGELIHRRDALQRWSLKFRDPIIEREYREHFSSK